MRRRNLSASIAFVAVACCAAVPAALAQQQEQRQEQQQEQQREELRPGVEVASLNDLPHEIRLVIGPGVSDRGGPFAPGCVSLHGEPHSRFAGARMSADTARVRMEYGGIAHYFDTLEFRLKDGRWVHVPRQPSAKPEPVPAPQS